MLWWYCTHPPPDLCRYASNTGLLILNKWLLGSYGFRRPVFLTLCHMVACSAMGSLSTAIGLVAPQPMRSTEQFRKIGALATVFCLSVVLGNVGLRFIPLSFSQARPFPTFFRQYDHRVMPDKEVI